MKKRHTHKSRLQKKGNKYMVNRIGYTHGTILCKWRHWHEVFLILILLSSPLSENDCEIRPWKWEAVADKQEHKHTNQNDYFALLTKIYFTSFSFLISSNRKWEINKLEWWVSVRSFRHADQQLQKWYFSFSRFFSKYLFVFFSLSLCVCMCLSHSSIE